MKKVKHGGGERGYFACSAIGLLAGGKPAPYVPLSLVPPF